MKSSVFASLAVAVVAVPALAGLPSADNLIQLSNLSFDQDMATRDVVVNYTLSGTNAVIRADVLTNGVSIGKGFVKTFTGDYSQTMTNTIAPGAHTFRWKARKDWPDQQTGDLKVKLSALYPEEAATPGVYDEFARTVYSNDFSAATSLDGWTVVKSRSDGKAKVEGGCLVVQDGNSVGPNSYVTCDTPAFEGLTDWRISFDLGVQCQDYTDWGQYWTRWQYSVSGLDAEGNVVFRLVGTARGQGKTDSTLGGVTIPGVTKGDKVHVTLLRSAEGTFSVFGPDGKLGTASAVIANPKAKLVKFRFTLPEPVGSPAAWFYSFVDNVKVEDISSAPF